MFNVKLLTATTDKQNNTTSNIKTASLHIKLAKRFIMQTDAMIPQPIKRRINDDCYCNDAEC